MFKNAKTKPNRTHPKEEGREEKVKKNEEREREREKNGWGERPKNDY